MCLSWGEVRGHKAVAAQSAETHIPTVMHTATGKSSSAYLSAKTGVRVLAIVQLLTARPRRQTSAPSPSESSARQCMASCPAQSGHSLPQRMRRQLYTTRPWSRGHGEFGDASDARRQAPLTLLAPPRESFKWKATASRKCGCCREERRAWLVHNANSARQWTSVLRL